MALPLYSAVLYSMSGVSTVQTCFTVPAGKVYIVRDIDLYTSAGSGDALSYVRDAVTSGCFCFGRVSALSNDGIQWRGRQVFTFGGGVEFDPQSHPWDIRISGYILDAP